MLAANIRKIVFRAAAHTKITDRMENDHDRAPKSFESKQNSGRDDLYPHAEIAIARAAQVAEEHGAKLTILHLLTQPVGDQTRQHKIVVAVEKDMRRKVLELSPQLERTLSVEVATGTAFVEIIRRAREHAADMLVVGAHGAQFTKNWLTGTIA